MAIRSADSRKRSPASGDVVFTTDVDHKGHDSPKSGGVIFTTDFGLLGIKEEKISRNPR
jgi:hypothetical protein